MMLKKKYTAATHTTPGIHEQTFRLLELKGTPQIDPLARLYMCRTIYLLRLFNIQNRKDTAYILPFTYFILCRLYPRCAHLLSLLFLTAPSLVVSQSVVALPVVPCLASYQTSPL